MKGVGASQRLFELLERQPAIVDGECRNPPAELHGGWARPTETRSPLCAAPLPLCSTALTARATAAGRIDFQDVHFTYASRPEHRVFRGLDLTVEPGARRGRRARRNPPTV